MSKKALETFRQKIRQLTRRSGGRSITQVIDALRSCVLGWKGYFCLAHTPGALNHLDKWMRRRMRAVHLKHWRHGATIYRELLNLGARPNVALQGAGNNRHWRHNNRIGLNRALTIAYFDRLGMPFVT